MNIVIDANVLFSALIKDSTTRKLILEYESLFLFPQFIFEELQKHKEEVIRKSGMDEKEFMVLLDLLLKKVEVVATEKVNKYYEEAYNIVKDIDKDDALFFACALAYPQSILWSDDKKLKLQAKIKVMNTAEMMNML